MVAQGGTNYQASLSKAYEILAQNKDRNDRKSCQQAILFMTDGEGTFSSQDFKNMANASPGVVVLRMG